MERFLIFRAEFRCDICGNTVKAKVQSRHDECIGEDDERRILDWFKNSHPLDALSCWCCKKKIQSHELEDAVWIFDRWKELCRACALLAKG